MSKEKQQEPDSQGGPSDKRQDQASAPDPQSQTSQSTGTAEQEHQTETAASGKSADPLETLTQENAILKDKLLRTLAEMENLRQRTEREINRTAKYAVSKFAQDILTVGDNISRAIATVAPETVEEDPALKSLLEGVQMTERELRNVLERNGVITFDAKNEPFDPNLHQAMFEVPNPDITSGTIVEVIQTGYMIGDRILRPAMVGVSTGGAKRPKEPVAEPEASTAQVKPEPGLKQAKGPEQPQSAAQEEPQTQTKPASVANNDQEPENKASDKPDQARKTGTHIDKSA